MADTHDRHRAAKAVQAVRATYVEDITRANQAIRDATDPDAAEMLRRARTILVGICAGLDRAAARLIEEDRRHQGGGVTRRDLQLLAEGWDQCVKSMRYEDGSPVEIVEATNPYRKMLEGLDMKEGA